MTQKRAYLVFNMFGLLGQKYKTEDLARLSPQTPFTYCSPKCNLLASADLMAGSASGHVLTCLCSLQNTSMAWCFLAEILLGPGGSASDKVEKQIVIEFVCLMSLNCKQFVWVSLSTLDFNNRPSVSCGIHLELACRRETLLQTSQPPPHTIPWPSPPCLCSSLVESVNSYTRRGRSAASALFPEGYANLQTKMSESVHKTLVQMVQG